MKLKFINHKNIREANLYKFMRDVILREELKNSSEDISLRLAYNGYVGNTMKDTDPFLFNYDNINEYDFMNYLENINSIGTPTSIVVNRYAISDLDSLLDAVILEPEDHNFNDIYNIYVLDDEDVSEYKDYGSLYEIDQLDMKYNDIKYIAYREYLDSGLKLDKFYINENDKYIKLNVKNNDIRRAYRIIHSPSVLLVVHRDIVLHEELLVSMEDDVRTLEYNGFNTSTYIIPKIPLEAVRSVLKKSDNDTIILTYGEGAICETIFKSIKRATNYKAIYNRSDKYSLDINDANLSDLLEALDMVE